MPTNFFTFSQTEISGAVVIFNLLFASAVCLIIALVHKKTHSGLSYSHSFFATIVLVGVVTTVILMVIQNNIFGALGLLGAFAPNYAQVIMEKEKKFMAGGGKFIVPIGKIDIF